MKRTLSIAEAPPEKKRSAQKKRNRQSAKVGGTEGPFGEKKRKEGSL